MEGLRCLVEAFIELALENPDVRLRIAGYLAPRDQIYHDQQAQKVAAAGLGARVDWLGEVDRNGKLELLRSLDVLCMPTTYHESKGLPVLEALASGVSVVLPEQGAFPELIEWTGGGVLVEPNSRAALVDGLTDLLDDSEGRTAMGRAGRRAVHEKFSDDAMATATLKEYERVLCMN